MYYLLHGGGTSIHPARNQVFFEKVAQMPSPILFVYFARYEHEWAQKFEEDSAKITSLNTKVQCLLANKEESSFINQLKIAPTVFISGGSTAVLKTKLEKVSSLSDLLRDKYLVGTSAGACILSTHYVNDQQEICAGLGIIPFKVFCHYDQTKAATLNELKTSGKRDIVLLLPEADFAEISV